MIFSEVINEAYDPREYPALSLLADYWISLRPFEGVKVLAATPIFRNTLVQYQALLAGGADLYVGYASGKNGAAMPCDKKIVSLIQENGIPVVTDEDIRILRKYGGYAVQCPDATVNVIAGIMKTAALSDAGVNLGLGSDIAGGHLPGIHTQAARSVQLSKLKAFYEPEENRSITFANAFHMATKEGGALFGKVGSLEPGYEFDALVIRDFSDPFRKITPEQTVERFCYTGNPSDILAGFIHGETVIRGNDR